MTNLNIDVAGVPVQFDIPDGATVMRAVVVLSYERVEPDGRLVEGSHWGASHMGTDNRIGMVTRLYRNVVELDGEGNR